MELVLKVYLSQRLDTKRLYLLLQLCLTLKQYFVVLVTNEGEKMNFIGSGKTNSTPPRPFPALC